MQTTESGVLKVTIYIGDSFRYHGRRLYEVIVELFHAEGIAGITVSRGLEGYGYDKIIHTIKFLEFERDLPIVIVSIDRAEKIRAILPKLDPMIDKGLVTLEPVEIAISRPIPI